MTEGSWIVMAWDVNPNRSLPQTVSGRGRRGRRSGGEATGEARRQAALARVRATRLSRPVWRLTAFATSGKLSVLLRLLEGDDLDFSATAQ